MTDQAQRRTDLAAALAALRQRLADAARAAGRDPSDIELLPVTKYFPASDVVLLSELGCSAFGEARDKEAAAKVAEVAGRVPESPCWHMIGRLQRNKARSVAGWADVVHSVDSPRLATALNRASVDRRRAPLGVYVQLSLDGDTARGGIAVGPDADALCDAVAVAQGLRLLGLMAVPPLGSDPERAFAQLAAEQQRLRERHPEATGLSAGMSGDLEIAVKYGSTCVRVGTALLGKRPITSPAVVTPVTSSSHTPDQPPGSPEPPLFREGSSR